MYEFFYILSSIFCVIIIFRKRPIVKVYKETDFLYTALGDDISKSLIAFLCRGFVYRVKRYLRLTNSNVIYNNFATPTFTSSDLLFQLKNSSAIRLCLKKSKVITISIGCNNLYEGSFENFAEINGNYAKRGILKFKEDWHEILYYIRRFTESNASIYVMTLYNPYNADDPNYSIAEYYISNLNSIIKSEFWIKTYNYKVVDIHAAFKGNFQGNFLFLTPFMREALPNYKESKKIGESFINTINS